LNQSFTANNQQQPADQQEVPRAIAVALVLEGVESAQIYEHLDELIQLADTAGFDVIDQMVQNRKRPDTATWIGKGKAEELARAADELKADLIIVDDDLSPAQARNLGKACDRQVIDRSGLILDIFARRARTREACTQVELAQLNYLLPRLTGAWSHLERQRGGVMLRGPGETQLETDRRLVRTRIKTLKSELDKIIRQRATRRKRRDEVFKVALVGYTNAGKSTLLNSLTGSEVFAENRLFATLDPTVRRLSLDDNRECLVADTVGFIRKLPHHLVAAFRSTLEEAAEADLLLHVIDLSHPHFREQMKTVNEVLQDLGAADTPLINVFNKVDLVEDPALLVNARTVFEPSILISAEQKIRIQQLIEMLGDQESANRVDCRVTVPFDKYGLVVDIRKRARVLSESTDQDGYILEIQINSDEWKQFSYQLTQNGCVLQENQS
jgi:GTPase